MRHLLASEGEADGRAIIDTFVARIEGLIAGAGHRHPTLYRHALAQLCVLRGELDRLESTERARSHAASVIPAGAR